MMSKMKPNLIKENNPENKNEMPDVEGQGRWFVLPRWVYENTVRIYYIGQQRRNQGKGKCEYGQSLYNS